MMAVITVEGDDKPQTPPQTQTEPTKGKMGLPHVTSFCCCFGLETGAKTVGFLHLLVAICFVVTCSVYAEKFRELTGTADDAGDRLYSHWFQIATSVAVVSVGHVLLAVTLVYGAYKRSTACLRLWVSVMSLVLALAVVFGAVDGAVAGRAGSGSDIFVGFIEGVIAFSIIAYCIITVYSYYLMVKNCEDMEGPARPY